MSAIIDQWPRDLNTNFTLCNCLFGSIELAKDTGPDKYNYSGYGIRFGSCSEFSFVDGNVGENVITFGTDMSASVRTDNENKDTLILREGLRQR